MGGLTIVDVKIVGMCSKCRCDRDEVMKDIHGRIYEDKELACVGCAVGKPSPLTGKSKGCGRTIKRICNGGENVPYLCGGDKLCPKCSPLTGLSSEEKKQ